MLSWHNSNYWQVLNWSVVLWIHRLTSCHLTLPLVITQLVTTSTPVLPSASVATFLTQVMPSPVTSTKTGWWSVMGTWRTQHWQRQSFQPTTSLSSCSSSTSNQPMMPSTTALPTQLTQMNRNPVTCTSMGQVCLPLYVWDEQKQHYVVLMDYWWLFFISTWSSVY